MPEPECLFSNITVSEGGIGRLTCRVANKVSGWGIILAIWEVNKKQGRTLSFSFYLICRLILNETVGTTLCGEWQSRIIQNPYIMYQCLKIIVDIYRYR